MTNTPAITYNSPVADLWEPGEDSKLRTRVLNALKWHTQVRTVADLTSWDADMLLDCRNFGVTCLLEVRRVLDAHGLTLKGEDEETMRDLPAASQALTRTGLTDRQLDYWTRRGYLKPEQDRPGQQGNDRHWPAEELEIAGRMATLISAGLTPERAAEFARHFWPDGELGPGIRLVIEERKEQAA